MAQAQWHETRAHVFQNYQCMIRLSVKLKFLLGLARKVAETTTSSNYPQVRETLGLLAAKVNNIEALIVAMEATGEHYEGYFVPNRSTLCTAQVIGKPHIPRSSRPFATLSGGGLIMVPSSSADFDNELTASIIGKTQSSPVATSKERVKLMKLTWTRSARSSARATCSTDVHSGATFVTRGNSFRFFDWQEVKGYVEEFMSSYDHPDAPSLARSAAE